MTVEATRTGPPPPPPAPRRAPPLVPMWMPDGEKVMVEAHHVADRCRLWGWSRRDPATVEVPPVSSVNANDPDGEFIESEAFADASEPRANTPIIDALRQELAALGGTYDARAGIASLQAEIQRLKNGDTADASD